MKHFKIILSLFMLLAFLSMVASSGFTAVALLVSLIGLAMFMPSPKIDGNINRSDISPDIAAIQKYVASIKPSLLRKYFNGLAIINDITFQPNVANKLVLPKLIVTGKPRPYTGNHKPNAADIGYGDRELIVDDFQRDIAIDPRKYRNTYLSKFRPAGSGANSNVIPFAEYTVETILLQNASMLNNHTAWKGLGRSAFSNYNPATAYVVGNRIKFTGADEEPHYYICKTNTNAGESPTTHPAKWDNKDELAVAEGLGTKLKAGRTAGSILSASTGVITKADGHEQALTVYRTLPEELRNQAPDVRLYGSSDTIDLITDGFKDTIGKYTSPDGKITYLPKTDNKCQLVKASWMNGSGALVASPQSNLYIGTDLLSDLNTINTVPQVYHLDMGLTGVIGFQYADDEAVVMNDQN
ncbi:hypothetical protein D3C86_392340 [compost metagenome]